MLNTNELKPHLSKYWCIPKRNDAAFVANMEDVPTIYEMPYNPEIPVICMDEKPIQLLDEIRERIQAKPIHTDPDTQLPQPGYCEKIDSGYVRVEQPVFSCLQSHWAAGGMSLQKNTGKGVILRR